MRGCRTSLALKHTGAPKKTDHYVARRHDINVESDPDAVMLLLTSALFLLAPKKRRTLASFCIAFMLLKQAHTKLHLEL